jgi:hypothetical protein
LPLYNRISVCVYSSGEIATIRRRKSGGWNVRRVCDALLATGVDDQTLVLLAPHKRHEGVLDIHDTVELELESVTTKMRGEAYPQKLTFMMLSQLL